MITLDQKQSAAPKISERRRVESRHSFSVINPATGLPFIEVPARQISDLDAAVTAARSAFPAWSATPEGERQGVLHAIGGAIEADMSELMELITKETGKPLKGLNGIGAEMEVGGAVAWTHATADLELPIVLVQDNGEARVEVHHKPLGVVGSIPPWNWPLS